MDEWSSFEQDASQKMPTDEHVQALLLFMQQHEAALSHIHAALHNSIAQAPETQYRAVKLSLETTERVFPQDLIVTDNELLRKVLTVLLFLCDEINELHNIAEVNFLGPLCMYGTTISGDEDQDLEPGDREMQIGRLLPTLQELSNFVDRCYSVCVNLVQQLASLYNQSEQLYRSSFASAHLVCVYEALGRLFNILITLDSIVRNNQALRQAWSYYKNMIQTVRADPSKFDVSEEKCIKFERLLVNVDQSIMTGEMFKGCVEQDFESLPGDEEGQGGFVNVRSNRVFIDELLLCVKLMLERVVAAVGAPTEMDEAKDYVSVCALYVLYRALMPANIPPDSKFYRLLWGVQKMIPSVVLFPKTPWSAGEFLREYAQFETKKLDPSDPEGHRRAVLQKTDESFADTVSSLYTHALAWMVLADTRLVPSLRHEPTTNSVIDQRGAVILKGISLAYRIGSFARSCVCMHMVLEVPMTKKALLPLTVCLEMLKAIEFMFVRKGEIIAETAVHIQRGLSRAIIDLIKPIEHRLQSKGRFDDAKLDMLACVQACSTLLSCSDSLPYARRVGIQLPLHILTASADLKDNDAERLRGLVYRLNILSELQPHVRRACDCSFLCFNRDLLRPLLQAIYDRPSECNRLQYLLAAYADGVRLVQTVIHGEVSDFLTSYKIFLVDSVDEIIVQPLCTDIENDLRLHVHTKTLESMSTINPKSEKIQLKRGFLDMPPPHILGVKICIRQHVTHHLETVFYNLTTVALHDWRTYADMRSLAFDKFNLELSENHLPMGSLDQGLDVLQIMRNIHVFVSRFVYNLNMQNFVEYKPDKGSKHTNTISIESIAASLRQHGLGILNTTVNFTYQFLAQKFHVFNQFLFDDYIKAHLSREVRWFKRNRDTCNQMYPYERAQLFVKEVKKLGVTDNGKSFLDQFRILITEIGNALGYVRMVRSAGMYYCSEAVKFLPEIEQTISFEECVGPAGEEGNGANLSAETVRAAKNLDSVLKTLVDNFSEGSDYFKVLVEVFQTVLVGAADASTGTHAHLNAFFIMVPSLCISWIDSSLQAKDQMYKINNVRGSREAYYTDDGFSMGLAYILAILKQNKKFDSLHWFDCMKAKFKEEQRQLNEKQAERERKEAVAKKRKQKRASGFFGKRKTDTDDEEDTHDLQEEVQTLQLSAKRLEAQRREVEQLFFSLNGARIFFKRQDN